jgi:flagellar biosynthesis regulator FlaF
MKGILSILTLILIAFLFYKYDYKEIAQKSVYAQQDSELALLMRDIHTQAKVLKSSIIKKEELPNFMDSISFIVDAIPTKENVQGPEFKAMALYYLQNNENLYENPDSENYNEMIESCIVCHQSFCPGPIKTIKKLTIK